MGGAYRTSVPKTSNPDPRLYVLALIFNATAEQLVESGAPLRDSVRVAAGGYMASLGVYHELHCLVRTQVPIARWPSLTSNSATNTPLALPRRLLSKCDKGRRVTHASAARPLHRSSQSVGHVLCGFWTVCVLLVGRGCNKAIGQIKCSSQVCRLVTD